MMKSQATTTSSWIFRPARWRRPTTRCGFTCVRWRGATPDPRGRGGDRQTHRARSDQNSEVNCPLADRRGGIAQDWRRAAAHTINIREVVNFLNRQSSPAKKTKPKSTAKDHRGTKIFASFSRTPSKNGSSCARNRKLPAARKPRSSAPASQSSPAAYRDCRRNRPLNRPSAAAASDQFNPQCAEGSSFGRTRGRHLF